MARKKKENTEVAVVPIVKKELVLEGDPEKQLEFAQKAATALMKRVEGKQKKVIINGKQYLEFGDWQTLARFFGATVGTDWTQPLLDSAGKIVGFEARAVVYQNGTVISSAEARCMRSEKRWSTADEYAVNSMAQTRASAKALRNAFGWVAELKGYSSTPAEEMPQQYDNPSIPDDVVPVVAYDESSMEYSSPDPKYVCADTHVPISAAEYSYSMKFYGKPLSRNAQKINKRIS